MNTYASILIKKHRPKYNKNFIDKNCIRKNNDAKYLIIKLFVEKNITIDEALNHNFLNDKNYNSEKNM